MKEQILNAIAVHNVGNYHCAKTNLDNYLANPAGIGEHPDNCRRSHQACRGNGSCGV